MNIWMTVSPRKDTQSKGHPETEGTTHGNTATSGLRDGWPQGTDSGSRLELRTGGHVTRKGAVLWGPLHQAGG